MQQKYILGVLLYLLIIGCTSENPSTENTENTDNNSESLFLKLITDYSPKFQKIIGLQKNAFRGVNLGMTKEEVMQIETAKQDEIDEEAGVIRYVVDFSLKENVDIEYYFSSENNCLNNVSS